MGFHSSSKFPSTCMYNSFGGQIVHNKAKGRISKRVFQESKTRQIFRKTSISYPLIGTRMCAYQGVRNVRFSGNLMCFVFLKDPFWDSHFCLITDVMNARYGKFLYLYRHCKSMFGPIKYPTLFKEPVMFSRGLIFIFVLFPSKMFILCSFLITEKCRSVM